MDPFDGSEGSGTIAVEDQASEWEWHERIPWDDDMREVNKYTSVEKDYY